MEKDKLLNQISFSTAVSGQREFLVNCHFVVMKSKGIGPPITFSAQFITEKYTQSSDKITISGTLILHSKVLINKIRFEWTAAANEIICIYGNEENISDLMTIL